MSGSTGHNGVRRSEAKTTRVDPNMRVTQLVIGYLIGGPLGGGLLGWALDNLFGTEPWLTLVMLFLGFGVGVRSIFGLRKLRWGNPPATEYKRNLCPARSIRCTSLQWSRWFRCISAATISVLPIAPRGCLPRSLIIGVFMWGGMKRQVIPGRWQVAAEGVIGFIDDLVKVNIGPEGKKFTPFLFSLFTFILVANFLGLLPLAIVPGWHTFTLTSHFTVTGLLAIMSFSLVLIVGFWRHGLHFFSLFVPAGTPWYMLPLIVPIEIVSLPRASLQPRAPAVRRNDVRPHPDGGVRKLYCQWIWFGQRGRFRRWHSQFHFRCRGCMLELLICALQAYVFALLTSLYLNDAINLH